MSKRDPRSTEEDRAPRAPVFLMATIESGGAVAKVKLRNISSGGALVEGADIPDEGVAVQFRRNGVSTGGTIAWRDGRFAGIRFDDAVETEQVLRTINRPRDVQPDAEAYRRPGFRVRRLTDAERAWSAHCRTPPEFGRSGT